MARSDADLAITPERLFQGAIADALTHVGQIALLRRLAEAPIRGENYSRAEIVAGSRPHFVAKVGRVQQAQPAVLDVSAHRLAAVTVDPRRQATVAPGEPQAHAQVLSAHVDRLPGTRPIIAALGPDEVEHELTVQLVRMRARQREHTSQAESQRPHAHQGHADDG